MAFSQTVVLIANASIIILMRERNRRLESIVATFSEPDLSFLKSKVSLFCFTIGNNTPVPIREKDWQYHD